MTRLAILILKSDDTARFEDTLASVLANRPGNAAVVVVCPGGYDDPYELGNEVTFFEVREDMDRVQCLNLALAELPATCEFVHILNSGLSVEEGWTESALAHFESPAVAAVAPLIVGSDGKISAAGITLGVLGGPRAVAAGKLPHRRFRMSRAVGPALMASFYRLAAIVEVGWLNASFGTWLAAADLALELRSAGYQTVVAPESRLVGETNFDSGLSAFSEGRLKERLFWKHRASWWRLCFHPLIIGWEAMLQFPSRSLSGLLGRAAGLLQAPFEKRRVAAHRGSPVREAGAIETRPAEKRPAA